MYLNFLLLKKLQYVVLLAIFSKKQLAEIIVVIDNYHLKGPNIILQYNTTNQNTNINQN